MHEATKPASASKSPARSRPETRRGASKPGVPRNFPPFVGLISLSSLAGTRKSAANAKFASWKWHRTGNLCAKAVQSRFELLWIRGDATEKRVSEPAFSFQTRKSEVERRDIFYGRPSFFLISAFAISPITAMPTVGRSFSRSFVLRQIPTSRISSKNS